MDFGGAALGILICLTILTSEYLRSHDRILSIDLVREILREWSNFI